MAHYSFQDFAIDVLKTATAPMSPKEIWEKGVQMGLDAKLASAGKTPWDTLRVRLSEMSDCVIATKEGKKATCYSLAKADNPVPPVEVQPINPTLPAVSKSGEHYSYKELVFDVLKVATSPMSATEIWRKAGELGLCARLTTHHSDPIKALSSWLYTQGEKCGLKVTGAQPKRFSIAESMTVDTTRPPKTDGNEKKSKIEQTMLFPNLGIEIDELIQQHDRQLRENIRKTLYAMPAKQFEELVSELLKSMGFVNVTVTSFSHDGGVDVCGTWNILNGVSVDYAVQVKRWTSGNVQAPLIDKLRGSLRYTQRGLFITTSDFSSGAKQNANDTKKGAPIGLIDGKELVELLIKHGFGVKRVTDDQARVIDRLKITFSEESLQLAQKDENADDNSETLL